MRSSSLVRLAARNATRKPTRTLLTAGMVVAGTSLLVVALAWVEGIFSQMLEQGTDASGHVRVVAPEFAAREALMPLYENIPDTGPLVEQARGAPGVLGIYPRITAGVTLTVGDEIGDVFGLAVGAPREWFTERMDADASLAEGRWFEEGADELVLGATLARRAGARLGDEVVVLGTTQDGSLSPVKGTLVGITRGGNALLDRQVFLPLPKMRWLADIPEGATEVLIYGGHHDDAPGIAAGISALPAAAGLTVQPWTVREPWAGMVKTIGAVQGFLVFIVVFLAGLGVWNTMMMSVLERTREVGVLRAMGLTRAGAVALFVGEAAAIAVLGGIVGVALGSLPAWWLSHHGLTLSEQLTSNFSEQLPISATLYARLTPGTMVGSFFLGLAMAVVGSALPALRAASIQPVAAMRHER
ncbi:ABC transporter permease [Myxococcota bacterium]|nr:ABC transporter permease [Myxococcota bacterium]